MQWINRIRQVKILLVVAAIILSVASLVVSNILVRDLKLEEQRKMEIWAEAMRSLNNADENTDMSLVLNVIQSNNTIPVIVMDADGRVTDYRNIDMDAKTATDSDAYVHQYGKRMYHDGNYIKIHLGDSIDTKDS